LKDNGCQEIPVRSSACAVVEANNTF